MGVPSREEGSSSRIVSPSTGRAAGHPDVKPPACGSVCVNTGPATQFPWQPAGVLLSRGHNSRAEWSPLGLHPSRAPRQPFPRHLPTKKTRTKLASVREDPLLTMLTRNRKKGYSSSEAQNSQLSSVQGRRGGTMGVSGKVPVL